MKCRRGLSSVIGMIFLVVVLSSMLGYFTYGIHLLEQVNDQIITKGTESIDKSRESVEIINVKIKEGKFDFTIKNTGDLPINIARLWINNMTDISWPIQNFTINEAVFPGQVLSNIGQNLDLYALESQSYALKLVTERGNQFNIQMMSPQEKSLEMNLFTSPRSVLTGQNVTIWYGVTNNSTDGSTLQLITPQIENPPDAVGGASAIYQEGPIPATKESLEYGDTTFFKWIYKATGDEGETISFNATVNNAKQGNYVTESIEFIEVNFDSVLVENAGVLQVEYETLEWVQGSSGWSTGWNLNNNAATVWRINVTNNDPTDTFYIGDDAALVMLRVASASTSTFYVAGSATTTPSITAYTDLSQSIGPGQELRIYFGATAPGGTTVASTPSQKGINQAPILMFGKMCSGVGCPGSGSTYGQNIPFLGILLE